MTVDSELVVQIAVPVATLFLGAWINRWFEKRPALTSYFGHVSAFKYTLDAGQKMDIYTHSVVLRNAGRKTANNVRLKHATLPNFQIVPPVDHTVVDLADGAKEILIPTMVPSEQITVSYLYFPPLTYSNVNAGIKSDEGFATQIPVLLQRQYPKWMSRLSIILLLVGLGTVVYAAIKAVRHL
jgi:hypothetical protein